MNIVKQLKRLREELEQGTDVPVHRLQVPAVLLLADVATVLGLSAAQRAEVIGDDGAGYLAQWESTPIRLTRRGRRGR